MGQIPNNFTILNRDYNTQRYNLIKKKKNSLFLSLTALFLTVYLSQFCFALYIFSSILLALTHTVLQGCTVLSLTHWNFSSLFFFPSSSYAPNGKWPNSLILFLHLFLVAALGISSKVFLKKQKLCNLIKRKFYILTTTTTTIKNTCKYIKFYNIKLVEFSCGCCQCY